MSSKYVREQTISFITDNLPSEEDVIDLTAEFDEMNDLLDSSGLTYEDNWLGCQFIGTDENPIAVGNRDYRESGSIFLHVVAPAKKGVRASLIDRAEAIRDAFRGKRQNDVVFESVTPPNFEAAATLQFQDGWTACSVIVNYYRDLHT